MAASEEAGNETFRWNAVRSEGMSRRPAWSVVAALCRTPAWVSVAVAKGDGRIWPPGMAPLLFPGTEGSSALIHAQM